MFCSILYNYSIFQLLLVHGEEKLEMLVQIGLWLSYSPFLTHSTGAEDGSEKTVQATSVASTSGFMDLSCVEDISIWLLWLWTSQSLCFY